MSQGLFIGYLLLVSKQNLHRNRWLALVLLTFILLSCKILLHTLGLWNSHFFRYFPLAVDLAIQPLIYLFIRSAINQNGPFKARQLLHFVPFLVFFIHALFVYIATRSTTSILEKDSLAEAFRFNQVKTVEDFLSIISAWWYGLMSYRYIQNYRKWLNDNIGDMTYPSYIWLRNMLRSFGILTLILTINLVLDWLDFGSHYFFHWQFFYLAIAVMIYYMVIQGYQQKSLPAHFSKIQTNLEPIFTHDEKSIELAKQKILEALQNKNIYRDPEISLTGLSEEIGLPVNLVSYAINNAFQKNFRKLINDYRIEDVKAKMSNPKFQHLSILGIALECGFNSEASFYRVFKKTTGKSPKEFIEDTKNS